MIRYICINSTFARERRSGKVYGFGSNQYSQIGVKTEEKLIFKPIQTQFENVKYITGKSLFSYKN